MKKAKKIGVAGCGWLGTQIGSSFLNSGWEVYASYRREDHRKQLSEFGFHPFGLVFDFENNQLKDAKNVLFNELDLLVISIPPFRKEESQFYGEALKSFTLQLPVTTRVIFMSSIGIYPPKSGVFNESYVFQGEEKENSLYHAEQQLISVLGSRLTILRLAGLIGPNRHPIKYLAGKNLKTDGGAPVSMIHSKDVVRVIHWIVENSIFGELFNVVYPQNLTKRNYYECMADRYELPRPLYGGIHEPDRMILSSSELLTNELLKENIIDFDQPFDDHYVK